MNFKVQSNWSQNQFIPISTCKKQAPPLFDEEQPQKYLKSHSSYNMDSLHPLPCFYVQKYYRMNPELFAKNNFLPCCSHCLPLKAYVSILFKLIVRCNKVIKYANQCHMQKMKYHFHMKLTFASLMGYGQEQQEREEEQIFPVPIELIFPVAVPVELKQAFS